MAILGYARVSVLEGDLSVQRSKLQAAGAERIFEEKKSGTSLNGRTEFEALMRFARDGDDIICTRIDRCARSVLDSNPQRGAPSLRRHDGRNLPIRHSEGGESHVVQLREARDDHAAIQAAQSKLDRIERRALLLRRRIIREG